MPLTDVQVPGSNPRMLEKSLSSPADCIAYDLEDAVATNQKAEARRLVTDLLNASHPYLSLLIPAVCHTT